MAMSKKAFFGKLLIVILIIILLAAAIAVYFLFFKPSSNSISMVSLPNPLQSIIDKNTVNGQINEQAVVQEGVLEFNSDYINYILIALGVGNLKSSVFGNPKVEFLLETEIWSSELKSNTLYTQKQPIVKPDITISMSKQEAVKALLSSSNIKEFMKNSVINGNTKITMNADKATLLAKGYLEMYNNLK